MVHQERAGEAAQWSPRSSQRAWRIARLVVTALLAAVWFAPMAWALVTALKPEGETTAIPLTWIPESGFTLDALGFVVDIGDVPEWYVNTGAVSRQRPRARTGRVLRTTRMPCMSLLGAAAPGTRPQEAAA